MLANDDQGKSLFVVSTCVVFFFSPPNNSIHAWLNSWMWSLRILKVDSILQKLFLTQMNKVLILDLF